MSKRSAGLTAVPIFMILGGVCGLAVDVAQRAQPTLLERTWQRISDSFEAQDQANWQQARERGLNDKQLADLASIRQEKQQNDQMMQDAVRMMREQLARPDVQAYHVIRGLLGVAALLAGIGMLRLRGWARDVATWQATLSLVTIVWTVIWFPSYQSQSMELWRQMTNHPALQALVRQQAETTHEWLWVRLLPALGWNVFVLWFVSRSSVKAQFTTTSV